MWQARPPACSTMSPVKNSPNGISTYAVRHMSATTGCRQAKHLTGACLSEVVPWQQLHGVHDGRQTPPLALWQRLQAQISGHLLQRHPGMGVDIGTHLKQCIAYTSAPPTSPLNPGCRAAGGWRPGPAGKPAAPRTTGFHESLSVGPCSATGQS